jgi:hypothetical protein
MRPEQARRYLKALSRYTRSTCFTGGEPLLFHQEIVELTSVAKSLGLKVSLVTGAGWVRDEVATRKKVEELAEAGLDNMLISWDAYHEEFLPRDSAVMLARLAVEEGIGVDVRTILPAGASDDGYRTAFGELPIEFEIGRVLRLGHAESLPAETFHWTEGPPKGVCGLVLRPAVEPDGKVYACCGPSLYSRESSPLIIGDAEAEPLEDILERAVRDPLLEIISLLGPYGLYLLLKDHPEARGRFKERSQYTGICELCLDINNSPDLVEAVRERLQDPKVQALFAPKRRTEQQPVGAPACGGCSSEVRGASQATTT